MDLNMEKTDKQNIDIYTSDVDYYLQDFMESKGIEDGNKTLSTNWAAAMIYIYNHTFKNNSVLHIDNISSNPYDLDKVNALCDWYIYKCYDFNQRICLQHFSFLSGIKPITINQWKNDRNRSYIYVDKQGNIINIYNNPSLDISECKKIPTYKAKSIYEKLVNNAISIADDIMLSRPGVNSIAYRNAVNERYTATVQSDHAGIDYNGIAESLGIASGIKSLADNSSS